MTQLACLAIFLFGAALPAPVVIPSGTILSVRLTAPVSSQDSSGHSVQAVLTVPVNVNGVTAIAAGAKISGKTADVKAAPAATASPTASAAQPATLRLPFDKMELTD